MNIRQYKLAIERAYLKYAEITSEAYATLRSEVDAATASLVGDDEPTEAAETPTRRM